MQTIHRSLFWRSLFSVLVVERQLSGHAKVALRQATFYWALRMSSNGSGRLRMALSGFEWRTATRSHMVVRLPWLPAGHTKRHAVCEQLAHSPKRRQSPRELRIAMKVESNRIERRPPLLSPEIERERMRMLQNVCPYIIGSSRDYLSNG